MFRSFAASGKHPNWDTMPVSVAAPERRVLMSRKRKLPDGMVEREGRDGYYADFTIGGRRVRKFLGTDFKAACEILNDLKVRAQKADFGLLDNACPIEDLRRQWLAHCKQALKPRTAEWYEERLDNVLSIITVPKVSQLTSGAILTYRDRRLAA